MSTNLIATSTTGVRLIEGTHFETIAWDDENTSLNLTNNLTDEVITISKVTYQWDDSIWVDFIVDPASPIEPGSYEILEFTPTELEVVKSLDALVLEIE